MPFFSVIVTVYNKECFIRETLQSILNQSFTDFELLIVNDGSTDNSLHEISKIKDSRIKLYSISNSGVSNARNYGAKKSSANYFAFIDGDDLWQDFHLAEMKSLISKYPEHKVFSCRSKIQKGNRFETLLYSFEPKENQSVDYFISSLNSSILHPSTLVIERNAFYQTKGFDTKFTNGEDTEYWFRLGLKYPIAFSGKTGALLRDARNSLSKQKYNPDNYCFFESFENINTNNKYFYQVLDNNLFSLALSCKENNYPQEYQSLKKRLQKRDSLSRLQLTLLYSPSILLITLKKIKVLLNSKGVNFTIYN